MSNSQLFTNTAVDNNIIDIDIKVAEKKKFRINKDDSKILELNTSDINIITRLAEAIPKLDELQTRSVGLLDGVELDKDGGLTEDEMLKIGETLKAIDNDMRDLLDFIFDSNVSEILASNGSMYDPFEGSYRFEYIVDKLLDLYDNNLKNEYTAMNEKVSKHTDKYTK